MVRHHKSKNNDPTHSGTDAEAEEETEEEETGYTFPASQLAYLKTKIEDYLKSTQKEKSRMISVVQKTLRGEIEQLSGQRMSQKKKEQLNRGVSEWFRTCVLSPPSRPGKKRTWAVNWHPRLVFQHIRGPLILQLAKALAREENHPEPRTILDNEESFLRASGELEADEWAGSDEAARQRAKAAFKKYQTATSMLWKALTSEEVDYYNKMADEWRTAGPPVEERRKMAERHAGKRCMEFAADMLNEMNARIYFLIAFEDTKGTPLSVEMEFTERLGAGDNFVTLYKDEICESEITDLCLTGTIFKAEAHSTSSGKSKVKRTGKKPLLALGKDAQGLPLLPSSKEKIDGMRWGDWLAIVLRSFFTAHWAIAQGTPEVRVEVPWRRISEDVRDFITPKVLSDELAECIKEPTAMRVGMREKLYNELMFRQGNRRTTQFEFYQWY
ncbi:hypothetical protein BKA70DRAFT_1124534, partial [Coprinopsis sp. MPI-PUGE-AT-0042]